MEFGSEFWAAIAGAIVGAVAGGGVSAILQIIAIRSARRDRKEERELQRQALGHSILFKAVRIQSNLVQLHTNMEEAFGADGVTPDREPWSFVLALVGHADPVRFSEQEMALILSFKNDDLTEQMMSLDLVHNNLIEIFRLYGTMRAAFQSDMSADMEGNVGVTRLSKEEYRKFRPKMVEMNMLLADMRAGAMQDYGEAESAVVELVKMLNDKLDLAVGFELKKAKIERLENAKALAAERFGPIELPEANA